ncbi:MAG TPA: hypothetical protein VG225_18115 [Terracidiphilus sp.]|jgi:hypothetical protein|nr:hypothetical protein [Terracidiphilus sp.]
MPRQQCFLQREFGNTRIEVLKTYDAACAREAFSGMDEAARRFLWNSLAIEEEDEVPPFQSAEGEDVLWEALLDDSREDGNLLSFFLVAETTRASSKTVYVSPDWPSAENYAAAVIAKSRPLG